MKTLVFIPARKGSKGVKGKNLKPLQGKPLVHYTFEICKKLPKKFIFFLSTDSKKILKYSKKFGFEQKYLRPNKLSNSNSNIVDAVIHGVNWLEKVKNLSIKDIILLQPTSPLRKVNDFKKAFKIYNDKRLSSLATVSKVYENSLRHIKLNSNKRKWKYVYKSTKRFNKRQDFPNNHFIANGNMYFCTLEFLIKHKSFLKPGYTYLYETDRVSSIDIDNNHDFLFANSILSSEK